MITVDSLTGLDGKEIRPGVYLIGDPGWCEESGKWRCLVSIEGMLALAELSVRVVGQRGTTQ
ncbi:MAG TPA: hypothetical protein VN861_02915 [Candidatus Acidoferrales bacterium]|nr:hypothetical protein [Candidatus Acidoferrales bacterium]